MKAKMVLESTHNVQWELENPKPTRPAVLGGDLGTRSLALDQSWSRGPLANGRLLAVDPDQSRHAHHRLVVAMAAGI